MSGVTIRGVGYVTGLDRSEPRSKSHLYRGDMADPGEPMCARGWNRDNGFGYSIFRNNQPNGICETCFRRAEQGRAPVPARERKTKWL